MPLDAICLGAVTEERESCARGLPWEKVYQPDRDEIVLADEAVGGARRLLVSTAAERRGCILLTSRGRTGGAAHVLHAPAQACRGKIAAVVQPAVERMLTIELDTTDEMGVACKNI